MGGEELALPARERGMNNRLIFALDRSGKLRTARWAAAQTGAMPSDLPGRRGAAPGGEPPGKHVIDALAIDGAGTEIRDQ